MANELILVIDDDNDLREFTTSCLTADGFNVIEADNGKAGIELAETKGLNLVLLDLNLPDMDGEDILKEIKSRNSLLPVIVVSGKKSTSSKVLNLGLGADDYVTKPFDEDELIARIKSNLKKYTVFSDITNTKVSDLIILGELQLDVRNFIVTKGKKEEKLSPRLFNLLRFFMENPKTIFDKETIYKNVWDEKVFDDNTVTVFIRKLRRIIETDPSKPKHLLTIWGEGYRFTE